ncbi:endoplasmic reticulum membrane-associated RNA degradation protein-like isoform X2 [Ornithodoros turicata]|uniref:endoplasmic reticulum membrane-associated RNA degradation protein-like isoform X2 n=1 Tax=Ornithodoros turicata TaxID=34597 RepID=UPI003139846C
MLLMSFLQILIGPPTSTNLRNIFWHGFVRPEEVDDRFAYLLICMCRSLGKKLAEQGIHAGDIPMRKLVNLTEASSKLQNFQSVAFDAHNFLELIKCSELVLPGRVAYFDECVKLYSNSCYAESLVLLLPQVECILRVLFIQANKCPHRLLTAETSTFYTTLDEILAEYVEPNKENQLVQALGSPVFEMFLDMFTYPDGPRIRDRVSHGEADLSSINDLLVKHVLCAIGSTCAMFLPKYHHLSNEKFIHELIQVSSSSQPQYHPTSLLKEKVSSTLFHIMSWKEFPQPDDRPAPQTCINDVDSRSESFAALLREVFSMPEHVANNNWRDSLILVLNDIKVSTLFRARSELECITVLGQITGAVHQTSEQICHALTHKHDMWKSHQLRSRQRVNYSRLLQSVPSLRNMLFLAVCIVCCCLKNINHVPLLHRSCSERLMRFLKMSLKCCENLRTLTSTTKNRWEESTKLCIDFVHYAPDVVRDITFKCE